MADGIDSGVGFGIEIDADLAKFQSKIENLPNQVRQIGEPIVKIGVDASEVTQVAEQIKDLSGTVDIKQNVQAGEVEPIQAEEIKPTVDMSAVNAAVAEIANDAPVIHPTIAAPDETQTEEFKQQLQAALANPPTIASIQAKLNITSTPGGLQALVAAQQQQATAAAAAAGTSAGSGAGTNFLNSLKTKLSALRQQGGRSSGIGQLGQLLNGGGALIGVTLIGRALEQATAKAAELSGEFRKGQVDASGMAVGIGESIPIFGAFVTAGQNIREIIYGEKAALEEVNKEIELGNKLIADRTAAYETTRNAVQGLNDHTEDIKGRIAVLNAPNEIERHKVQIDVEYKTDSRGLKEQTTRDIEARKKESVQQIDDITKSYADKNLDAPKEEIDQDDPDAVAAEKKRQQLVQEKTQKIQSVQIKTNDDVKQIQAASDADQKALDQWHTTAKAKASGIGEELRKLNEDIASKLATTDTEKVDDYRNKMVAAGHSTQEAADLAAKFADSLKADHLADFNQSLQELNDKLQTVGNSSKETAINEMALQLQRSGIAAADAAAKLDEYRNKYDQVQESLKHAAFGDAIKGLQEQTAKFGATPIERANKLADFSHATDQERKEYIDLVIRVEQEEKLQKVADTIKDLKEQAAQIPNLNFANPSDEDEVLAKLKSQLAFLNATPNDQKKAIEYQIKITGEEKAEELYGQLKAIDKAYREVGQSEIQKQIDEMERLAKASGDTADKTKAINKARKELEESKVGEFIKNTNEQTKEVGESEPDKAVDQLKAQGITDPKLLADAWMAAAKKAGAELKESVETPLEKLQRQVSELNQLKDAGAIDDKTYNRAVRKDQSDAVNSMQGKSIEDSFKDNIKSQMLSAAYGDKPKDEKEKATVDNTKATVEATKSAIELKAAFDRMVEHGMATQYAQ